MIFCHNCQQRAPQDTYELKCGLCGCEAVQMIEQPAPRPQRRMMNPLDLFGFRMMNQPIQAHPLQNFFRMGTSQMNPHDNLMGLRFPMMQMMGPSLLNPPEFTTIIFLNGQQQEPESKPVDKETINNFPKIASLSQECSICQQEAGKGIKLTCGHEFHQDCIRPWFQNKNSCPCCRQQF